MIRGFSPDLPRTTPQVMTACEHVVPGEAGMEGAQSPSDVGLDAVAAAVVGAASLTKLDGTVRTFVGTATKLYELSSTSWTDRSAGGGSYATTTNWQFTQFGDTTLAVSTAVALQSTSSGAFAAVSGAPKAKVLFSVITSGGGFVLAANTDTSVDQWACSGVNDHTTWTPSVATQANSGRLLGNDNGAITAGIELGDAALLFKKRTLFVGRYVGGSETFAFSEVPGGAGCVGPDARCTIDVGVFFVGPDQFWIFDGARPLPIGTDVIRKWFFANSAGAHLAKTICVFERHRNRVRIFYASSASTGSLDAQLVYHLGTQQWGRDNLSVEYAFLYTPPDITMDNVTGTMDNVAESMDSDYWRPSERYVTILDTSHTVKTLSGASVSANFMTEDFGGKFQESYLRSYRMGFQRNPTTALIVPYTLAESGGTATGGNPIAADASDGTINKFDLHQSARFHRLQIYLTGDWQLVDAEAQLLRAGAR